MLGRREDAKLRYLEKTFRKWEAEARAKAAASAEITRTIDEVEAATWKCAARCVETVRTG